MRKLRPTGHIDRQCWTSVLNFIYQSIKLVCRTSWNTGSSFVTFKRKKTNDLRKGAIGNRDIGIVAKMGMNWEPTILLLFTIP